MDGHAFTVTASDALKMRLAAVYVSRSMPVALKTNIGTTYMMKRHSLYSRKLMRSTEQFAGQTSDQI